MPSNSLEELKGNRVLVFGAGGGGDALGALGLYAKLEALGAEPLLGSIVWERRVVDPTPGPIPIEVLARAKRIGDTLAIVTGDTIAVRPHGVVKPQIARIAGALGIEALFLDISKGEVGLSQALRDAIDRLGVEYIIGLDTGGDILARGYEEGLRSPLADAVSLAALAGLDNTMIAVLSPGADGELDQDTVMEYASRIAGSGGLIGVYGLSRREYNVMKRVEEHVVSEASKIPLRAFEGRTGELEIRAGTRRVKITLASIMMILLDTSKVWEWTPLGRLVKGTNSIEEARRRLNKHCIFTELDLEYELARLGEEPSRAPASINEIYRQGVRRLMYEGCTILGESLDPRASHRR